MILLVASLRVRQIDYPERDGIPLSEEQPQSEWITLIKAKLDALYAKDSGVFVASNILWYPVEGDDRTQIAPDVLIAFGRPKELRDSYRKWDEGGIAPQVVFDVVLPSTNFSATLNKYRFYEQHGVEEFYLFDPAHSVIDGWARKTNQDSLERIDDLDTWISPRLGVSLSIDAGSGEMVFSRI